jgi:hypothetical protein
MRGVHHIRALSAIAIASAALTLCFAGPTAAKAPHIPTPSKGAAKAQMGLGLAEEFGHRFTASAHSIECGKRISRTILRCDVYFHFHDRVWNGRGRIWRGICNGTGGTTKNGNHVCWFANWRLKRFDESCYYKQHHSLTYCTKLVVRH